MKMKRKGMAILLAAIMSLGMFPTFGVLADDAPQNLVVNPGFEDVETRTVDGSTTTYLWTAVDGESKEVWSVAGQGLYGYTALPEDACVVSKTDETEATNVRSGDYAMKVVSGTAGEKRRVWQKISGLTPGDWYEASVWVKAVPDPDAVEAVTWYDFGGYNASGTEIRIGKSRDGSGEPRFTYGWVATSTDYHAKFNLPANVASADANGTLVNTFGKWSQIMVRWQQPQSWDDSGEYDPTTAYVVFETGELNAEYYYDDVLVREINGDFNGGFEAVTNEKISADETIAWPSGVGMGVWYLASGLADDMQASSTVKKSGNYSLQMESCASKGYYKSNRSAHLFVPNLKGGETYKLTGWVKLDGETGSTRMFGIGPAYTGSYGAMWNRTNFTPAADGAWKEVSLVFTVPEGFTYGFIQMHSGELTAGSNMYWDDISVTQTSVTFTKGDNTITATADYVNQDAANPAKVKLMLAVYAVNGTTKTLKEVSIVESGEIAAKNAGTFSTTLPYADATYEVKAMLYDSTMAGLSPICSPFVYPKEA